MKRLIDEAVFAQAFAYGRRSTVGLIRQHAALYAVAGVALAALLAWDARGASKLDYSPAAFIAFPALAAAVRLAKPDYRMRFRTVVALIGVSLLTFSPLIVLFGGSLLFAKRTAAIGNSQSGTVAFGILVATFFCLWIVVKFSAAWTFFALREDEGQTIFKAMADSWRLLSGAMWWRVVGLGFAVALICQLLPDALASGLLVRRGGTSSFLSIFVWALIVYATAVPATIWMQAAYVALISASEQRSEVVGSNTGAEPAIS